MLMLRSRLLMMLIAVSLCGAALSAVAAAPAKVLIVVSSEGRDQGKTRPGFEMDEFAQAWLIFRANGLAVEVASPAGGRVEADKYNAKEPFNAQLLADADAVQALAATRATRDVRADDYAAVYVVGGKGAMFDLPADAALTSLLASVYDRGGVVAAVCHGPAALAEVRRRDGSLLVADRRMTGFTNEEESVFGKRWASSFPFLLEEAMRERGAHWHEAPLMMPNLVVDDRLITGQNPYSTTAVAEAIVTALGRTPTARTPWRDEATMALVQRHLAGESQAVAAELAERTSDFHVELIGLLGYYQLQSAKDDAAIANALSVMELAQPHMPEPQLALGIADAHWRLGRAEQARTLVAAVVAAHPDMDEAKALQATMGK
jgi:putative intracellular protease/amidase